MSSMGCQGPCNPVFFLHLVSSVQHLEMLPECGYECCFFRGDWKKVVVGKIVMLDLGLIPA